MPLTSAGIELAPRVVEYTPPIGSDKGSFAGDGWGLDHLSRNGNETVATGQQAGNTNGIIAVLIGL